MTLGKAVFRQPDENILSKRRRFHRGRQAAIGAVAGGNDAAGVFGAEERRPSILPTNGGHGNCAVLIASQASGAS